MNLSKVSLSKFFISLLALVVLVYIFDLTANLPIPYIHQITTSTILIIQVLFLATYSIVSIKNKRINKIFLILLPVTLMPFISAFCSTLNFNQPFFYGFLSERTKFDFVLGIILIVALERNFITIQLLKKLLYRLAFFYFLICLFFYLVIDPNLFEGSDFVIFSSSKGFIYRFNLSLIVFLFFYSYCEIIFSDKISIKSILYSVATLSFLIFIAKARSLTAAVVVCSFGFGLLNTTFRKKLILYSIGIIIAFLLFSAIFLIFPEELSSISALFVSAFNVFIGGEVADMSAASRITQLNIGKEGFLNSPIFGNGTLSSQWNGGFEGVFEHFDPSDIGWVGILYLYGIFGFLVFKFPFIHSLSFKYHADFKKDIFLNATKLLFLLLFLHGVFAGYEFKRYGIIIFIYSILYYYNHNHNNQVIK